MTDDEKGQIAMQMFGTRQVSDISPQELEQFFKIISKEPPDNHCRTCKFWTRIAEYNFGYCYADTGLTISDHAVIFYPETFGCIFHEAK